jgi:4-carboxymuconolactone decarboxylase
MTRYLSLIVVCLIATGVTWLMAQAPAPNPREVRLVGDRFKPLTWDEMNAAQRTMIEHLLSGPRKGTGGPFNVLLRSPEMGDVVQEFGAKMRFGSSLPPKLNEMAIIIVGRHWTSHYEWNAHRTAAAQAGLNESIIQAIAQGKRPAPMDADETIIYNFATELLNTKQVGDANFKAVKDRFGERGVVDLIGVMGYYQLVSMLLNVDRHPLPAGAKQELQPLK